MAENGIVNTALETYATVNPIFQQILIAVLILLVGLVVGRIAGKFVRRLLNEFETDKNIEATLGWDLSLEKGISNFITYFIYFVAVIMALDTIGVTSAVLNMIAGIIILLLLVSVVLAIKDFVPNAMAGVMIKTKKEYAPGKKIKIKNLEGEIDEIGILETKIKTGKDELVLIPNSMFTKNEAVIKK